MKNDLGHEIERENALQATEIESTGIGDDANTDFEAVMDQILYDPMKADSKGLRIQAENLREEIRQMMIAGRADQVMRLQQILREYPARIFATECAEIRKELDSIEDELKELKTQEIQLRDLKREKNQVVVPLLEQLEVAQLEVRKVEIAQAMIESDKVGIRERRKELNERLQQHLKQVGDMEKTDERFIEV